MMTDRVNLTKARATNERNGYRGDRMKNIPHLFAKATIIYCIAFASGASLWALYKQGQGASMAEVLAIILGFFGGELLMLCLKTILKKESKDETFDGEQSI